MDIKLPIRLLATFCIIFGCFAADNVTTVTTIKPTTSSNPLGSSCRLSNRNVQRPLRARIFYRIDYDYNYMNGCIDAESLRSYSEPKEGTITSKPLKQRYLIHLAQKVFKRSMMQVRVDIYAKRKYSQPLDITLVLSSVTPFMWDLNLAHMASSVSSNISSRVKVILTHNESTVALEQIQLPGWYISVEHKIPKPRGFWNISKWTEEKLFNGQPLTMSVNFPVRAKDGGGRTPLPFLNVLDLTILPNAGSTRKPYKKMCGKTKEMRKWIVGFIDTNIDDGYTSCHTENVWTSPNNISDTKWKSLKLKRRGKMKLLQTLEFTKDLRNLKDSEKTIQLRVEMAPNASKEDIAILALLSGVPDVRFLIDLRGLKSRLYIHVNFNQSVDTLSPDDAFEIVREPEGLKAEDYLARIQRRYDNNEFDSDSWHVERVRFARLLRHPMPEPPHTFIDISLSPRPLMLCNLETLVHLQCFNTQDLAISLNAKTFDFIGLKRDWVLLGKDRCEFSESKDGRWVRKFLVQTNGQEEICGTQKTDKGSVVVLTNTIYVSSPHNASTGLSSYPLAVQCVYPKHATDDFPPLDKQGNAPIAVQGDTPKKLWSTWDGKDFVGPPPVKRSGTSHLELDLFGDEKMKNPFRYVFLKVKSGQTLYVRIQPKDQTVDEGLMIRDCYLSNTKKEIHPMGYPRQYLLIKGCNMGDGFSWKEADSYRVKIFSFVTPRLGFFSMGGYIYLHCNVQSCNYVKKGRKKGLPQCWNQLCLCDISEPAPATTHLVSMALQNADGKDSDGGDEKDKPVLVRPLHTRSTETMVPLWGAVIIAVFAFLLGIVFTFIMWCVHNRSSGHCHASRAGDRMRHRRRPEDRRSNAGDGRCFGNKDLNFRGHPGKSMLERAPHYRPLCLHRLMDEGRNVGTDDAPDEVVAKLLATHHAVAIDDAGGQVYQTNDDLFDGTGSPGNSTRVKNGHSISCTVCGEGSSSGIGTGNCSSCSAQTCSLVDENEQPRQLPPDLGPSPTPPTTPTAYLSYQQQQQPQQSQSKQTLPLSSHFASA